LFSFLINTIKIICPHIYQAKGATVDFCFQLISLRSGFSISFHSFSFVFAGTHIFIVSGALNHGNKKRWQVKMQ